MRNYEKILVTLSVITLVLRAVSSIDPATKLALTAFALMVLSVSYLVGGYWLFRKKDKKFEILSIIAGIVFCPSIFVSIYLLHIEKYEYIPFWIFPNQILFLCVGIFLIVKRKNEISKGAIRGIFIRSAIIAIFSSFLYYAPDSFSIVRDVMAFFNNGDKKLLNNLKMVEYYEKFKTAYYVKGDAEDALIYAEAANRCGKLWLGIDTNFQTPSLDSVKYISGTYEKLYDAYKWKGEDEFGKNNFTTAIVYYTKAANAIYYGAYQATGYDSIYYAKCNTLLEERIAVCHSNLKEYNAADSLFNKAINEYRSLPNKEDTILAQWLSDFSISAERQNQFSFSTQLLRTSLSILRKDTVRNKAAITQNYYYLAQNYIAMDSIQNAMGFLNTILNVIPQNDQLYCAANLYYGVCLYKLDKFHEADALINKALACFRSSDSVGSEVSAAYYGLTYVKLAIGDFKNAGRDIKNAIRIASKSSRDGEINPKYMEVLAFLDREVADYKESEEDYKLILSNNSTGKENILTAEVGLSHLYIITGRFNDAKSLSNDVLLGVIQYLPQSKLSYVEYINDLAYVRYCLGDYKYADTLYQNVIKICKENNRQSSSHMAIALNGLGLVKMAQRNYRKADSLFTASEGLHLKIFGLNNPYTALLYLNFGTLKTLEGDYPNAHKMLNNAFTIDAIFFEKSHDVFADIYIAEGDLCLKGRNKKDARADYESALTIYFNKFGKDYYKVLSTQKMLQNL